ncbi:hypothetical protein B0I73DRAFT_136916 [Yarrowia lipolytica]|nr:hypothetical protein BKA91DRAFT_135446 [Yarrowia lipolytica]KAE8173104.1 hypothetical protein BKA90DRAFT_136244 [Yarrowia lipolytica]RDW36566.1 hypothetical protein B0I73DRAFT_136916 [Yarrowia lipolytica]RMI97030.1 hypothetical protein BD777DRAFT_127593 [Yarrowia lipolytica]
MTHQHATTLVSFRFVSPFFAAPFFLVCNLLHVKTVAGIFSVSVSGLDISPRDRRVDLLGTYRTSCTPRAQHRDATLGPGSLSHFYSLAPLF